MSGFILLCGRRGVHQGLPRGDSFCVQVDGAISFLNALKPRRRPGNGDGAVILAAAAKRLCTVRRRDCDERLLVAFALVRTTLQGVPTSHCGVPCQMHCLSRSAAVFINSSSGPSNVVYRTDNETTKFDCSVGLPRTVPGSSWACIPA
jgi:hypothetical protein